MKGFWLPGLVLLVAVFVSASEGSATWQGAGCWNCESRWLVGEVDMTCKLAGDGHTGEGTDCNEYWDGWGWMCQTNNTPCYNINVDGGGGGSTGGTGGSTCVIGRTQVCPAQCASCERLVY